MKIVSVENIYKSGNFFLWVNGVLSSVWDTVCIMRVIWKYRKNNNYGSVSSKSYSSIGVLWRMRKKFCHIIHNLILCYRLKRNCCFKNYSLFVAISTIRVYQQYDCSDINNTCKVDLVTITFLPIDLSIHICITCFDEYLLSSI